MPYLIGAIAFVVIILIMKGVRIVPQAQNWILERFGKYVVTLKPGLNLINPLFSKVPVKIDIRERVLDMPMQPIITSDNATIEVNGVVFYKVMDPYKAYYGIEFLQSAIANLAKTTLRAIMGKMALDETLSNRDQINSELLVILDEATDAWGTKITRVEIQDIEPPRDIADAMARQMKAERNKRAQILEAEGNKQSEIERAEGEKRAQILAAEGRKQAADLDAQARERLAQAEANALKFVTTSLTASGGDPVTYLLGQKYVEGLIKLGNSSNGKILVLPPDLINSLSSMFKK